MVEKTVKKAALIVTDGAESTQKTAEAIAGALDGFSVTLAAAGDFEGAQLLGAELCFFGAEVPRPPSFSYLDKVLRHINLSGRSCGIFSSSAEALEYLAEMIRDSQALLPAGPFSGGGDPQAWAKKVAAGLKAQ